MPNALKKALVDCSKVSAINFGKRMVSDWAGGLGEAVFTLLAGIFGMCTTESPVERHVDRETWSTLGKLRITGGGGGHCVHMPMATPHIGGGQQSKHSKLKCVMWLMIGHRWPGWGPGLREGERTAAEPTRNPMERLGAVD